MSFAGGTEEAGRNGATEEAARHGERRRLRRSERIVIDLVQVKRIVATRKYQSVKSALRTDNEKYETCEQNSFGPVSWNSRQNAIKRLGVEQEEWNSGSAEQPSRSEIRMLARRIRAKPEIEGNRQNRHEQDQHSEARHGEAKTLSLKHG